MSEAADILRKANEQAERLFDADIRVEAMIWLPGIGPESTYTEAFENFVEDDLFDCDVHLTVAAAFPKLAEFAKQDDMPDVDDVAEYIQRHGAVGFLFQGATPVRAYHKDGQSASLSWGHYYTSWLYAATESEIADVVCAWAEERDAYDKNRAIALAEKSDV